MAITIPGTPFSGGVTPNATTGMGMHAAPKTQWGGPTHLGERVNVALDNYALEIDKTAAQDAINQTRAQLDDLRDNKDTGWGNTLGQNALQREDGKSLTEEYLEKGRNIFNERTAALKTPRQRQFYEEYSRKAYQDLGAQLQKHTVQQQKVVEKATDAATFKLAQTDILSGDLEQMRSGRTAAAAVLQKQADRSGIPVDVYQMMGTTHAQTIANLVDGNRIADAQSWLNEAKDEMSPTQIETAQKQIKAGRIKADSEYLTQKLTADSSKSDFEIYSAAKEATKGRDKDTRDAVMLGVRRYLSERNFATKLEVSDLVQTAEEALSLGQLPPATAMERLRALDPGEAAKVQDKVYRQQLSFVDFNGLAAIRAGTGSKTLAAAAEKTQKDREADPIGEAIKSGQFGYTPLDWRNPEAAAKQLKHRTVMAESLSQSWHVPKRLFSTSELSGFLSTLDGMEIDQRVGALSMIAETVGSAGIRMVSEQLKNGDKQYGIAMAGFDIRNGDAGMTAGEMYLRGKDLIKRKVIKFDDAAESGVKAQIYGIIDDEPNGTEGLFYSHKATDDTAELASGISAYMKWGNTGNVSDAVNNALGGQLATFNGKKVVLPRGINDADATYSIDLIDLVNDEVETLRQGKDKVFYVGGQVLTANELADRLPKLPLQTESVNPEGSVTYSVIYNGEPVYDKDRNLFTFDLMKGAEE